MLVPFVGVANQIRRSQKIVAQRWRWPSPKVSFAAATWETLSASDSDRAVRANSDWEDLGIHLYPIGKPRGGVFLNFSQQANRIEALEVDVSQQPT